MLETNIIYTALTVCSAVSLLLIGLSIPLALGKITRNHWYGFRTPKTLASDSVWYPANHAAAVNFIFAGLFTLLAAVILFFMKNSIAASTVVWVMVTITIVSIVSAIVKSFIFLNSITAKS